MADNTASRNTESPITGSSITGSSITGSSITRLSHVAIAVPDLDIAIRDLEARLGLVAGPVSENAAQGVRLSYIDLRNARIELISPIGTSSPVAKFLERNPGGGLHHVAFNVADLDAVLGAVTTRGVRPAGQTSLNVHGDRIAFLSPRDLCGVLVELEETLNAAASASDR